MRIMAGELPFQSRPVAIDIGNDDWRRVVSAHNFPEYWRGVQRQTLVHVEGLKFPLAIDEKLQVEVSPI